MAMFRIYSIHIVSLGSWLFLQVIVIIMVDVLLGFVEGLFVGTPLGPAIIPAFLIEDEDISVAAGLRLCEGLYNIDFVFSSPLFKCHGASLITPGPGVNKYE